MSISKSLIKLVELITDVVVGIILLRVVLELLGASNSAPFVAWIHNITESLLVPFKGILPPLSLGSKMAVDLSGLFAVITYSIIGYLITSIIRMTDLKTEGERKK